MLLNCTTRLFFRLQCDELVEHGASVAETPAAVVKKCKYTIAMLSDPSAAFSVSLIILVLIETFELLQLRHILFFLGGF